jgi:hypothetical protein
MARKCREGVGLDGVAGRLTTDEAHTTRSDAAGDVETREIRRIVQRMAAAARPWWPG